MKVLSIIEKDDLFDLIERLMAAIFELKGERLSLPFSRLTYEESLNKYGTDKPDLRIPMEIQDLTAIGLSLNSEFIKNVLSAEGVLKGLLVKNAASISQGHLDKLNEKVKELGAKGLIWIKKQQGFKSSLKLEESDFVCIWENLKGGEGDLALLVAEKKETAIKTLGEICRDWPQGQAEGQKSIKFAWVTEFPLFEWSEEERKLVSMHHPFTSPLDEDLALLEKEPRRVRAKAYDLVLNGVKLAAALSVFMTLSFREKYLKFWA